MGGSVSTVFVVDDDVDVCASLEAVIGRMGHACTTFNLAQSVLDAVNTSNCDCLVIDVDLPDMTGIDLLIALRISGIQTPAILYTGRADERVHRAVTAISNVQILQKGEETVLLAEFLNAILIKNA